MRDVLWSAPPRWIVAFRSPDRNAWLLPPLDVFFDVVELDAMPRAALTDLLQQRVNDLPEERGTMLAALAERIVDVAPAPTPGAVLAAARQTLSADEPEQHLARREESARAAERLGDRSAALLAALQELGSVSASDPRLSEKLGVSRSRVAQLLGGLAEQGLAVATGRDGRRTLYQATP